VRFQNGGKGEGLWRLDGPQRTAVQRLAQDMPLIDCGDRVRDHDPRHGGGVRPPGCDRTGDQIGFNEGASPVMDENEIRRSRSLREGD
jgi:hypothetical protein